MDNLYTNEAIYKIKETNIDFSKAPLTEAILLCKKTDLSSDSKRKLTEILGALNWVEDKNCRIISIEENQAVDFGQLANCAPIIISFGFSREDLSIQSNAPVYGQAKFENTVLIRSHSINEIINNKTFKIQLWNSIKEFKTE